MAQDAASESSDVRIGDVDTKGGSVADTGSDAAADVGTMDAEGDAGDAD
jgi:hypothetical protein